METLDSILFGLAVGVGFLLGYTGCRGMLAIRRDWKASRSPRMHDSWLREQQRMQGKLQDDWRRR